jgi:hypothetical protein
MRGPSVARDRGNHDVESLRCAAAICGWIRQRIDDLQLLDDRSGPPVRDDDRQSVRMFRTDVNEVNIESVYVCYELWVGTQLRLDLAPVVIGRPIVRELLHSRELDSLRRITDRFPLRPLRRGDTPTEVRESLVRNLDAVWTDCVCGGVRRIVDLGHNAKLIHDGLLLGTGVIVEGVNCVGFARPRAGRPMSRRARRGGLLSEHGSGRCQRHRRRKEHDEEEREQAEGARGVGFGYVLRFIELSHVAFFLLKIIRFTRPIHTDAITRRR